MEAKINPITLTFNKYVMILRRGIYRKIWMRITGNTRPGSYPYVSGDSFRSLAQHVYDEEKTFNPADVKYGDIVFVCNVYAHKYMHTIHQQILNPYILIVHNGDESIDEEFTKMIDDKIIKCYAQDVTHDHEKIIPIGIALENKRYYMNGIPFVFNRLIKKMRRNPPIKQDKILFRFSVYTNPTERKPALDLFSKHPLMETFSQMLPPSLHLRKLMTYKFVASPPGNSIESCRTWEALELRTVPIVKDFVAYRYFVSLGLPMWIVKDWKELDAYQTPESLAQKYDELMKNPNWEPLRMDYWISHIKTDQESALKINSDRIK